MTRRLAFLLLVVCSVRVAAQDSSVVTDGFRSNSEFGARKIIATAAVGSMVVISLVWSYDSWWKDTGRPFHFYAEGWLNDPVLGIDKFGHLYTSYFYFHTIRNVMLWGGCQAATADWWGAGSAMFFALVVELGDGASNYGFDYQDLVFNAGGVGYGWLQTKYPALRNFNLKWSYVPKEGYRWPLRLTQNYDPHTYWLTCNVRGLLPSSLESYWPEWLQLAVGYGVDDKATKREFVFGLDINLESLFAPRNEELLLVQKTVNMFHLPAPAVKFTEGKEPRYYLFHLN